MKEIVYRCNRCSKVITGTRNRIGATDGSGEKTKYGALFDDTDLCDNCMEKVALALIEEIDNDIDQNEGVYIAQQNQNEEANDARNSDPATYKCSEVIKTCDYSDKTGAAMICNYIEIEGHRRGCDPEACDKYKKTDRKSVRKTKKEPKDIPRNG